jgi:hypothetical protein
MLGRQVINMPSSLSWPIMSLMTVPLVSCPFQLYDCASWVHVSAEELLINFKEIIGQHTGENLAEAVWGTLELYGITDTKPHDFTARFRKRLQPLQNELAEFFSLPAQDFDSCNPIQWWYSNRHDSSVSQFVLFG